MEVRICTAEDNWVKSGGRLAAILAIETGKKKVRDPLTPLPYPIKNKKLEKLIKVGVKSHRGKLSEKNR